MGSDSDYRIGFDLGGTKMFAAVFDGEYSVLGSAKVPTQGYEGAKAGVKRMVETIDAALSDAGLKAKKIASIGVGCPGVVDFKRGILHSPANLGWGDIKLGEKLNGAFDCPVAVLNDVDAGTYGEYTRGAGRGSRSVLGVFPGTGVGGGFVYEGKILRGKSASCMEIGNVRLVGTTLEGEVGENVKLEALASRLGVASTCAVEAYRGNAPTILELAGTDLQNIKSGTIKKAIDAGDDAVRKVMLRSIEYLGIGIAAAVDLLGPEVLVLGGGLAEKMPELYIGELKPILNRIASRGLVEDLRIKIAELGDLSVAIGGASYAYTQLVAKG